MLSFAIEDSNLAFSNYKQNSITLITIKNTAHESILAVDNVGQNPGPNK